MNAVHTQWTVFIGVWMRYSGGVHPGEVTQSGLARFEVARDEVARVEVALVEVARVCTNTGELVHTGMWMKTGNGLRQGEKPLHKCSLISTSLQYNQFSHTVSFKHNGPRRPPLTYKTEI